MIDKLTIVACFIVVLFGLALSSMYAKASEASETALYCASIGGIEEVIHRYGYSDGKSYIKVDCETEVEVIEAGLDKRGSLDSVQQATFFHLLTGKIPVVVIYDTDGREGKIEYRIRRACEYLNIEYRSIPAVQ